MKFRALFVVMAALAITGCDDAKKAGDDTARELTGANMIEQGKKTQQQLKNIDQLQQQRFDDMEDQ